MSPNPAHNEDPTPIATSVGETLDNSSLFRLLGRIEQKCDGANTGLRNQAEQIRGLHVLYNEIRNNVMEASRLRPDVEALLAWRIARENSDLVRAAEARGAERVTAAESAQAEKSTLAKVKTALFVGAATAIGSLAATGVLAFFAWMVLSYVKEKS